MICMLADARKKKCLYQIVIYPVNNIFTDIWYIDERLRNRGNRGGVWEAAMPVTSYLYAVSGDINETKDSIFVFYPSQSGPLDPTFFSIISVLPET